MKSRSESFPLSLLSLIFLSGCSEADMPRGINPESIATLAKQQPSLGFHVQINRFEDANGCEYLIAISSSGTAITPRLDTNGQPSCGGEA